MNCDNGHMEQQSAGSQRSFQEGGWGNQQGAGRRSIWEAFMKETELEPDLKEWAA